jgi:hypothetical protein
VEVGAVRALRAAALHERVLVVEAGPGWGKSTAVRAAFPDALYVEVPAGARAGAFEAALLVALGLSAADAGSIVARTDADATAVLRAVLAAHERRPIVIDDIQRLDLNGAGLIEALVEAQTVRLVIVGRSLSVLPIGTWVARGFVGMPFGPDVLALRSEHVTELFSGLPAGDDLLRDVTSTYAGWPLAGAIAAAALRRGDATAQVREQLAEGIASIAASVLDGLDDEAKALLVESAVRAAYGLSPTAAGLAQIRQLALPESQSGLHELFVAAVLKSALPAVRAAVARRTGAPNDDPSALYALLCTEAPDALYQRAWQLLAPLHDRYDRSTLERIASDPHVDAAVAAAARSFVHVFASQFDRAASEAEPVFETIAARDAHTALRVARSLVHAGRAVACVGVLQNMAGDDPAVARTPRAPPGRCCSKPAHSRSGTASPPCEPSSTSPRCTSDGWWRCKNLLPIPTSARRTSSRPSRSKCWPGGRLVPPATISPFGKSATDGSIWKPTSCVRLSSMPGRGCCSRAPIACRRSRPSPNRWHSGCRWRSEPS